MESQCTIDWAVRNLLHPDESLTLYAICQSVYDGWLEAGEHVVAGVVVWINEDGTF